MPPKKKPINGFFIFMLEKQQSLSKNGIKMNLSDMPKYCQDDWEKMPSHTKEEYKIKAKQMKRGESIDKYTSLGEKIEDVRKESESCKTQANSMYHYIEELVQMEPSCYYLPKQKFIFVYINQYSCNNEDFFFPAEVTLVEFSLKHGLIRIIREILGFDKTLTFAPAAPTAEINIHAKNNHHITTFNKLPIDYKATFFRLISFIIQQEIDENMFHDIYFDLPPIYTAQDSTGNELSNTAASFYQLYKSAVKNPMDKADFSNIIKIYQLDKLFMEVKNKAYSLSNSGSGEKALPSIALASDSLLKDEFNTIKSIGCDFHEQIMQSHVCSNYYVCKWMYILSTHCCHYFDIKLQSGLHFDFDLSNTQIPMVQDIRFSMENLMVSNSYISSFEREKNKESAEKFPALGGKSTVVQPKTWVKPSKPVQPTPVSNKSNNFPPLSSSKTNVLEQTSSVKSWSQISGCDGGVRVQDNNIAPIGCKSTVVQPKPWAKTSKPVDTTLVSNNGNDFPPLG